MREDVPHSLHWVSLPTLKGQPLLDGALLPLARWAAGNLEKRFPGLKVVKAAFHPDRVSLLLDLGRLDEDLLRIVQSFKSEVKSLAKKKGTYPEHLWQWNYEERWITSKAERAEAEGSFEPVVG